MDIILQKLCHFYIQITMEEICVSLYLPQNAYKQLL